MTYYHTDDPRMLQWLENVLRTTREQNRCIRFRTEGTTLKVKVGEGVWTAPFQSTPDPYRDSPVVDPRPDMEAVYFGPTCKERHPDDPNYRCTLPENHEGKHDPDDPTVDLSL